MSISLDKAIAFAVHHHTKQKDKGGNSYILHVLRVMLQMNSEDDMIVAVLHDVVEDTPVTLDDLRALGCTEAQLMAIDALTKKEGQTPEQYLALVKQSVVARRVKIADVHDNMKLNRLKNRHNLGEKDFQRIQKYLRMLSELEGI